MLAEIEETSPTIRRLKINIPFTVIEEEITKAYNKLRATAKIPGFRAGKVPQAIIEKRFGSEVKHQVIEKIIPEFYTKALQDAQITPLTLPHLEGDLTIRKDQPISFTATIEIKPEIKDINYDGIVLKERTFSVEEDEIEMSLQILQEKRAMLKVSEGPLKEGDVAIINCQAFLDDKEVTELALKNYPFVLGSPLLPKEFSSALSTKKKGEDFEIKINFDSLHPNKEIAGREVLLKVSVTELKEKVVPAIDDEFAKSFNLNSVEELRSKIREETLKRRQKQVNNEYKEEIIKHLLANYDFDVPLSMLNREIEYLVAEAKQEAAKKGEAIKSDNELRKEYESKARENVKVILILESIGKKETVEVSDDDVNREVTEIAVENEMKPEDVKRLFIYRDGSLEGLKNRLYTDKILDLILSKAVIEKAKTENSETKEAI